MELELDTKNKPVEILIVEDSPTQAVQLEYTLEQNGFLVSVAGNGNEALALLKKKLPTIVISDVIMPEMDGYQLCENIKKDDSIKDVPVILLTSLSQPEDVIKGLQCGANNFIVKPYEEEHLLSRIQYILANQEIRKVATADMGIEIIFSGRKYYITSDRIQIVDLLLSTYESSIQRNRELVMMNTELEKAKGNLASQAKELLELSLVDELTKLNNRRGFITLAKQQLKIGQRAKKDIYLFFVDMDGMKWINDNLGHNEGDVALIDTSNILKKTFRDSDIVARLGGDEFVALTTDTNDDNIEIINNRLNNRLSDFNSKPNIKYKLALSVGVAQFDPEDPCTIDELLSQADKLMYEEKKRHKQKLSENKV